MNYPAALVLGCSVLGLVACGFQLRGEYRFPAVLANAYVEASSASFIAQEVKQQLRTNNIPINEDKNSAATVIRISNEQSSRRSVALDANAKVSEYQLSYSVVLEVLKNPVSTGAAATSVMAPETLRLSRDYQYDPTRVLGHNREEQRIVEQLQTDLIRVILLRLQGIDNG